MKRRKQYINHIQKATVKGMLMLLFSFWSVCSIAQSQPEVSATIDSTQIKIGEQINYLLRVEADTTARVVFPQGQTFRPLEMIDSTLVDTTKLNARYELIKKYGLTQFDSGFYFIPRQKVLIDDKAFFTDSIVVRVNDIVVDTLKQKMFDIKPLITVNKSSTGQWLRYTIYALVGLLVLAVVLYFLIFRKKALTEEEKVALLPPYERALISLKNLENSQYLIKSEHKKYYSELTDIVRNYIEEDVHISAMESTTDELIVKLEMMKDGDKLKLEKDTIDNFKRVLQTADLVKFARSKPENKQAETDTMMIEEVVKKTKEALPEPVEEELMQDEDYLEALRKKKQKRRVLVWVASSVFGVLLVLGAASGYYGFDHVKDTVLGHPSKKLLEGEWISSTYSSPGISVSSPKVLKRKEINIPAEARAEIRQLNIFEFGGLSDPLGIQVKSTVYNEQKEPDFEKAVEEAIKAMEAQGVKNIVVKNEKFSTLAGAEGVKTYGSGDFPSSDKEKLKKGQYVLLTFGAKGILQEIMVNWQDSDSYANEMAERIINSVELKTEQ